MPSHDEPAGHTLHDVRVVLVLPEVKEPGEHAEHFAALLELYRLSAPQSSQPPSSDRNVPARQNTHCVAPALDVEPASHVVQLDAPGSAEKVPAAHSAIALVPLHAEPAGHSAQLVRVVLVVPPDVNEPNGQRSQTASSLELK